MYPVVLTLSSVTVLFTSSLCNLNAFIALILSLVGHHLNLTKVCVILHLS